MQLNDQTGYVAAKLQNAMNEIHVSVTLFNRGKIELAEAALSRVRDGLADVFAHARDQQPDFWRGLLLDHIVSASIPEAEQIHERFESAYGLDLDAQDAIVRETIRIDELVAAPPPAKEDVENTPAVLPMPARTAPAKPAKPAFDATAVIRQTAATAAQIDRVETHSFAKKLYDKTLFKLDKSQRQKLLAALRESENGSRVADELVRLYPASF